MSLVVVFPLGADINRERLFLDHEYGSSHPDCLFGNLLTTSLTPGDTFDDVQLGEATFIHWNKKKLEHLLSSPEASLLSFSRVDGTLIEVKIRAVPECFGVVEWSLVDVISTSEMTFKKTKGFSNIFTWDYGYAHCEGYNADADLVSICSKRWPNAPTSDPVTIIPKTVVL